MNRLMTAAVLLTVAAAGCASRAPLQDSAHFVHVVLFKTSSGSTEEAEELVRDIDEMLASLPTVKGIWVGTPAPTNTRDLVDVNYDVGLMLLFEDQQGLRDYLEAPKHVQFATKHDTRCEVRVFDFVPGGKPLPPADSAP